MVENALQMQGNSMAKKVWTDMIEIESADRCNPRLSVAQVHNRVVIAIELQSSHTDAVTLHNYIVLFPVILAPHVLHTIDEHKIPNIRILYLVRRRKEKEVVAVADGWTLL